MVLVLNIIVSALVALLGRNRKIGYGWSLLFCLVLSPIIGLIIILCSKKNSTIDFVNVKQENKTGER